MKRKFQTRLLHHFTRLNGDLFHSLACHFTLHRARHNSFRRKDKRVENGNNLAYLFNARVFRRAADQPRDYMTPLPCSFDRPSRYLKYTHPQYFLKALTQCERQEIIKFI